VIDVKVIKSLAIVLIIVLLIPLGKFVVSYIGLNDEYNKNLMKESRIIETYESKLADVASEDYSGSLIHIQKAIAEGNVENEYNKR
jgi:hypothetical protein